MLIYNSDSFKAEFDQEQGWLHFTCSKRLQFIEFKEGMKQALACAEENKVKRWLLDAREIGCLNEEEETWLQSCMFPKIMSSLGTNNYVAVVLSERCYHALLMEAGRFGLKSYNSFIIMNTFCEPEDALSWLDKEVFTINK
ncbi:hypothetical protein ABID22_002947 [Pontibacter aydingkolensis]|uniref:SpoIIAA-like n=1 Tax=Pontibacter aydingkolensis TaxID=1911536 RepID=A0ABS7CXH1_9BACT|nr:hypothetical protein [Pontibacter aydingkolensis]MBW7468529.1 hypothetical protein [Pontibacter aydingkolensis]